MARRPIAARTEDRLKDEIYRQMLRLEAERPSADLHLAVALLRAWIALEQQPANSEPRQWLRRICPVGLRMIDVLHGSTGGCCSPPRAGEGEEEPV